MNEDKDDSSGRNVGKRQLHRSTYLVEMVLMEPVVTIRIEMSTWYIVQAILTIRTVGDYTLGRKESTGQ